MGKVRKRCSKCKTIKDAADFSKNKSRPDGLSHWCRACKAEENRITGRAKRHYQKLKAETPERIKVYQRRTRLLNRYGLTEADFARMLESQQGACALCQRVMPYTLYVDHDHATGAVRGLLCARCNGALGWFEARSDRVMGYLGGDQWLTSRTSTPN